jgi:transcriptional regulator with XRE-family HTH domain
MIAGGRRRTDTGAVDALPFLEQIVGGPIGLGALLEAIRQGEEETQTQFAARLGISRSHLCDIEKGRKVVSPDRAARFAELLGYSPDQFVRLALQDSVNRTGLRYTVQLSPA